MLPRLLIIKVFMVFMVFIALSTCTACSFGRVWNPVANMSFNQ